MNRTLLAATLALALTGGLAFAQDAAPAPEPAPAAQHHHALNPHRQAMRLSRQLNLTSDQTAKVESLYAGRDQQIAEIQSDTTLSPLVAQAKLRDVRKQTRQQLSAILTPDQLQQMSQMHRRRSAPSQVPSQAPASPGDATAPPPSTN